MLTVKLFSHYGSYGANALVENYGREFSVFLNDDGEVSIHGTNVNQYRRRVAWQRKADAQACEEFIRWAHQHCVEDNRNI